MAVAKLTGKTKIVAVLSLIVMPLLAKAKRRTAAQLNSAALHADSRQTSICAYLSAILVGGLYRFQC
jgi:divalent metal cation (Fe/Co/Zn/Cd) transporter